MGTVRGTDLVREWVQVMGGLIRRSDHPELVGAIEWLARTGELVALLPGVYCAASLRDDFTVRAAAVMLWDPDAVIAGRAAVRLGFQPSLVVDEVVVFTRRRPAPRPGYVFRRIRVDAEHIVENDWERHTSPGWTAVWLAQWDDGDTADEAMRLGRATPAGLVEVAADLKGRTGAALGRFVAENSSEQPWSPAERRAHMMLREGGIGGWRGNHVFSMGGRRWPADIVFEKLRLVIEIDGFASHSDPAVFHDDHEKALLLMAEGWVVVRFSWPQLADPVAFIAWVRAAMAMAAQMGGTGLGVEGLAA